MILTLYDWLTKSTAYMATVVSIVDGCGLGIYMCHKNQPNKNKLVPYKPLLHCKNHLKQL